MTKNPFPQTCGSSLFLLGLLVVFGRLEQTKAIGLGDIPIGGEKIQYLDGTSWNINAQLVTWGLEGCSCEKNVDYNEGVVGPKEPAASQDQCCTLCSRHPDCFAGVLYEGMME